MSTENKPSRAWMTIHRSLAMPCWPAAEQGPAAIICRADLCGTMFCSLLALSMGRADYDLGIPAGDPKRVLAYVSRSCSMMPNLYQRVPMAYFKGRLPVDNADVFGIWDIKEVFPKLTMRQAAERILEDAFGGGAVYHQNDFIGFTEMAF